MSGVQQNIRKEEKKRKVIVNPCTGRQRVCMHSAAWARSKCTYKHTNEEYVCVPTCMNALLTKFHFGPSISAICHLCSNICHALFSSELTRRERQRRKRRQRWVWGSIAAVITVGTAALAWSYLPTGQGSSGEDHFEASEHDHETK